MSVSVGGNASRVRTSSVPRRAGFVTRAPAQAPSAEVTAPATTTKTATSRVRSSSVPRQRAGSVTRAPTSTKEAVSIAPQPSAQGSGLRRASFPLSGGRSMAQGSRRICGCARQAMKFRTLAVILMSVCQAPSESSFDELRLHELCTSIILRLLLL